MWEVIPVLPVPTHRPNPEAWFGGWEGGGLGKAGMGEGGVGWGARVVWQAPESCGGMYSRVK